ncbi:hypothetical protein Rleg2_4560 (plasmid) [Rhizobium leguminosarum bv. trifolii WSM2304]|uniref:Uncharacterized protein n=1 Tax=Rhizobium leguminosarum bv. trifolii (strain WSM2304) TaxID=395492 RepID=A0ABF7QUF4_RHILW|nr:hypothetical protein [Rhizobium leguminosarum]ACI57815.1 hypothetical protein Rleg2_4560 [Rhizobium leguminosarum bv. trifolii WSM2304]
MPAKSDDQHKIDIKYLSDNPVKAATDKSTRFSLGGIGFIQGMIVYIARNADGTDEVAVEICPDPDAVNTDKLWSVVAKPAHGLDSTKSENPLWVAIKLKNQFKDAYQGFLIV